MTEVEEGVGHTDGEPIDEDEQLAYLQTVIAVLVRRCGGSTVIGQAELESVVGHGIRLSHGDAGLELATSAARAVAVDEGVPSEDGPQYLH